MRTGQQGLLRASACSPRPNGMVSPWGLPCRAHRQEVLCTLARSQHQKSPSFPRTVPYGGSEFANLGEFHPAEVDAEQAALRLPARSIPRSRPWLSRWAAEGGEVRACTSWCPTDPKGTPETLPRCRVSPPAAVPVCSGTPAARLCRRRLQPAPGQLPVLEGGSPQPCDLFTLILG